MLKEFENPEGGGSKKLEDLTKEIKAFETLKFTQENEIERQQIENLSLLKRNKELNGDIESMHEQFKTKETDMHKEQEEWIAKYHDQIDRMTKLGKLNQEKMQESEANYDKLEKKYIEQDQALVKYKKEVEGLIKQLNRVEYDNEQMQKEIKQNEDQISS